MLRVICECKNTFKSYNIIKYKFHIYHWILDWTKITHIKYYALHSYNYLTKFRKLVTNPNILILLDYQSLESEFLKIKQKFDYLG